MATDKKIMVADMATDIGTIHALESILGYRITNSTPMKLRIGLGYTVLTKNQVLTFISSFMYRDLKHLEVTATAFINGKMEYELPLDCKQVITYFVNEDSNLLYIIYRKKKVYEDSICS